MIHIISRTIFEIFIRILFKLHVSGRENIPNAPYIVVSNHASLLDPPLVGIACKKKNKIVDFIAKEELFEGALLGCWTRAVNCIFVDRKGMGVGAMKEAVRRLKAGRVVGIFPEGTRSENGSLQEGKRGVGFLIAKARVPVVPIYIEGSGEAFPKGKKVKKGSIIDVYIGKAIQPNDFTDALGSGKQTYELITNMVMERIAQQKEEYIKLKESGD